MTDDAFSFRRIAVPAFAPSLLFGLGEGAILPVVALSVRQLGGSVALAALVVTLMGIGSLVSNIPASIVATRFGERKSIAGAAILGAVAMLVCGFGPGLATFAAGAVMIGMAGAVFGLARQSWLAETVPFRYRARAMSTLGGVMRIGLFIGPFIGAALIPWLGIAASYVVGAAALAGAAAVAWKMPDLPAPVRPDPENAGTAPSASAASTAAPAEAAAASAAAPTTPPRLPSLRGMVLSYRHVFATVGIGVMLIAAVRATRQAIIPLWAEQIGLDAATTSLIYGLASGIDMLVFYPAGKVMDLKGRVWVAVPCTLVMGLALLAMPFSHSFATLLAVSLVLGFGNGIGSGILMTLGADYSPALGRAHFLGLWRLMSDIGATGGPALLSAVIALGSLASGIWVIGALSIGAAALLGYWIPRVTRP